MKNLHILLLVLISNLIFCQNISERYKSTQAQDTSVPPPPRITFPAQFPGGNKLFLEKISEKINQGNLMDKNGKLQTTIILKISAEGEVLNISTFGTNQKFNEEVSNAAKIITQNINWDVGKNRLGEKVIDVIRIPFKYKN